MNSQQKKKKWGKKSEFMKRRGKKNGKKSKDCCAIFQPKNYLEILLSAHAQMSQANILHLDQRAARKFMTCKQLCGKFYIALYSQTITKENCSTSFQRCFLAKFPGANGLTHYKCHSITIFFNFWPFPLSRPKLLEIQIEIENRFLWRVDSS